MQDSNQLINAITKGDQKAFAQLYQLFSEKVYNTALSYTQNKTDAEEITQEVFILIFRKANQFKGDSTISTWIYRITVNVSLNYLKAQKRRSISPWKKERDDASDFNHPGVLLENKENASELFRIIKQLPENQKTAIILSFIEDLPRQEVADVMELSLKAVESLLQRAKKNLRKQLKK